jgi:hypothetical protein
MPRIRSQIPACNPRREIPCQIGWARHKKIQSRIIPLPCGQITCQSLSCRRRFLQQYEMRLGFHHWKFAMTLRYPRRSDCLRRDLDEQHRNLRAVQRWMQRNLKLCKFAWCRLPSEGVIYVYLLIDVKLSGSYRKAITRNGFETEINRRGKNFFYGRRWVREYLARCDAELPKGVRRVQTNMPKLPPNPEWEFVKLGDYVPLRLTQLTYRNGTEYNLTASDAGDETQQADYPYPA